MSYSIFKNPEETINGMTKSQLNRLYHFVDNYFRNCEDKGLELRYGQLHMAISMVDIIERREPLVIEAGVGIGKSYAYLIPLLYYHYLTGKSFIISTSTIALQEQLENDLKKLLKELRLNSDVVIAKGMSNFLCLNRLERYKNNSMFDENKQDRKDYPEVSDKEWNNVCANDCTYNSCRNKLKCEFLKRRRSMKETNGIIICNHDLLINDMAKRNNGQNPLLKNSDYIVCDEAHNLENKIRTYFTKEIDILSIRPTIGMIIDKLNKREIYDYNYNKISNELEKLNHLVNKKIEDKIKKLKNKGIDLIDCNGISIEIDEEMKNLSKKLWTTFSNMYDSFQVVSDWGEEYFEEKLYDKISMFEILTRGNEGNNIIWVERKNNKNHIYYAPKNIYDWAYKMLFNNESFKDDYKPTFVFTSATLSINDNDYSYFMDGIGLDKLEENITIEDSQDSPYNYDEHALVYACDDIENPSYNKEKYLEQLVEKIKELIKLTNGKALVLFTSKNDMNYVYSKIGKNLGNINIFVQKDGSSQDIIKEKFKSDTNSVLFSTGAFWEGIDIQGESLSNLIIARLPFPIVDPIMEYKSSLFGKEGFNKVYIPEMLIKLKQGVGRLIRSKSDTGIVCILDSRFNRKYKDTVRESIPIKNITSDVNEVKKLVKKYNIDK